MSRCLFICFVLLPWLTAHAATNLPPAKATLLDDKTAFALTAGLEQYRNPPRFSGRVTSMGGGSPAILVNRWAAEFATIFPDVEMDSHGGGAETGLSGLMDSKVDLVPMARPLLADEATKFKAKFGYEPTQIVVALDAVGIFVNKDNPITGLTLAQLDAIYSRDAKRGGGRPELWGELGLTGSLADKRIERVSLSRVHGSHVFFQELVMQGTEYRFDVRFEAVAGSLVQAVGADDDAVGFASIMFATERTRFVPLQADDGQYLPPSYENTVNGKYPLVRPMRIVFHRKPNGSMNPAAREFLRFAVSRRGQRIIALAGSYPLTASQQSEALRAIGDAPETQSEQAHKRTHSR